MVNFFLIKRVISSGTYYSLCSIKKKRSCLYYALHFSLFRLVSEWEGEVLDMARISRLDMGAYLCIASNGVPPTVSKRVKVSVDCKYFLNVRLWISVHVFYIKINSNPSSRGSIY